MPERKFTVTAALPYSNGRLHVGHIAGCYLPADTFVRYLRSRGEDVAFICGSDDYGVPVALTARKEGKTPRQVSDHYRKVQKADFKGLGIEFDTYGGTSKPPHDEISRQFFLKAHENGYLEKRRQKQLFDPEAQMFLPDRYVEGICHHCQSPDARGDQCETCGRQIDPELLEQPRSTVTGARPEIRETVHWFFLLSKFEDRLRDWIESHTEWRPMVRNFARGLLDAGLPDRAITRDLEWGIPVPLESDPDAEGKVLYVWFDAPIGYVSFTADWCERVGRGRGDYEKWWKNPQSEIVHFIGEDNVVFHALMWPAMLMAQEDFELPSQIPANCFLNVQFPGEDERKISKSRGNAIWIGEYLSSYDPDPLRYYLTMIAPEDQRTTFKFDDFINRNNDELVACLGNLVHRTITFAHKYCEGKIPTRGSISQEDRSRLEATSKLPDIVAGRLEDYGFKAALHEIMAAARETNRYFDMRKPWVLRKENMEECKTVLNVLLNTIKTLGVVAEPFLPFAAAKISSMLACEECEFSWHAAAQALPENRPLGEAEILFAKLEHPEA